ncbi:methylaspartate mutase [Streptomyces boluensis]|uniref:Methylaspartate mutase n=1 Tax=Streptomyces boluensis TaxID=1775135 RepID=A0A964UK02_9ACTN|nr:methylaspartate mutase [Streptomyces boluensis]NBE50598.1 methylaspartate mutase [Streptomyces boluensis]
MNAPIRSSEGAVAAARTQGRFSRYVHGAHADGRLVVQPRMGFADLATMREGLLGVRGADATATGTITLDSYTRVNDHDSARQALRTGAELNGFPLVAHGPDATRQLLDSVSGPVSASGGRDFPVQVRHGSALPYPLFEAMVAAGVDATEGGPVSYCLPYSRAPISAAVKAWAQCCELIAAQPDPMHLESFGGCMLGQLCPPSLLVALSVLEGLFFREHGLSDISLSYAQQTHPGQDLEAIAALRRLAGERLAEADWHVVLYTFMGVFPRTPVGSFRILEESVRLAVRSGSERLIVKTPAEAHRIPTIAENVDALEFAASIARDEAGRGAEVAPTESGVYEEARLLVDSTLELAPTVGEALIRAFERGHLDVPYCLHQDNANKSRAYVDPAGMLQWAEAGRMPLRVERGASRRPVSAKGLLTMLGFNEQRFDREQLTNGHLRGLQYPGRTARRGLS